MTLADLALDRAVFARMSAAQHAAAILSYDPARAEAACAQWALLPDDRQYALLQFGDRAGVSLHMWCNIRRHGLGGKLTYAAEYRERRRKNEIRLDDRRATAARLITAFHEAGLRAAILKGFLLAPDYVPTAVDRLQNDIDFLLSPRDARAAFEMLLRSGYRAFSDEPDGATVHLPMLLPADLVHRGDDCFNPHTQPAIELHDLLWVDEFERIPIAFHPDPLTRIVKRDGFPMLDPLDQLATCTLHAVRHVFRGSLRASHLYEIAGFLDNHIADTIFWKNWIDQVNAPLRRLCACGFALAAQVFQCRWPSALDAERETLPPSAQRWIARHAMTVLDRDRVGKEQVFLQLAFVEGFANKLTVVQRRLAPMRIPSQASGPDGKRFLLRRAWFHTAALFKLLGMR